MHKYIKKEEHNYLYDIIEFWLSNEKNEYYIMELLDKVDGVFELENKSIAQLVLEKFCTSCREELISQKRNIVDKNYYLRIFNKIYNHEKYKHNEEEKLNKLIKSLNDFVANGKFKLERKIEINATIASLTKPLQKFPNLCEVEESDIRTQIGYFKSYVNETIDDKSRMNFTDNEVILIGNSKDKLKEFAYSISYTKDGCTLLRFHVLDIASLMYEDTPLYDEMKNNNRLNDKAVDLISLNIGKVSPTITYQLNIDGRGRIFNFKYYRSLIKPQTIVDEETTYKELKKDFNMKQYVYVYKILQDYYEKDDKGNNLKDISCSFVNILNDTVGKFIKVNELPCIHKVQDKPDMNEFAHQIINLNWFMFRLKDEDFRIIYNIICNKNNTIAHYSLNNIGHYSEDKKHVLDVTKPFSFVGLKLQELMMEFATNKFSKDELIKRYGESLTKLVNYYNKKYYGFNKEENFVLPKKKATKVKKLTKKS